MSPSERHQQAAQARAEKLDPGRKKHIAHLGAQARWQLADTLVDGTPLRAVCGTPDTPVRLRRGVLHGHALNDHRRVVTAESIAELMGIAARSGGKRTADRLAGMAGDPAVAIHLDGKVFEQLTTPIRYQDDRGDVVMGFAADAFGGLCRAILTSEAGGGWHSRQANLALAAERVADVLGERGTLSDAVDRATRFPAFLAQQALVRRLKPEVDEPLRRWLSTFPVGFFEELCRLEGVGLDERMPLPVGAAALIREAVTRRLPTRVYRKIQKARLPRPRGKGWHDHQPKYLTERECDPGLARHLAAVTALMKVADDRQAFDALLDRVVPVIREVEPPPDAGKAGSGSG